MAWLLIAILVVLIAIIIFYMRSKKTPNISILPERFVIFDLETTGLKPEIHEIIEIGAIRVNRDSNIHDTYNTLILPSKKIPHKITKLTGITQEMTERDGVSLDSAISGFIEFIGDLPIVSYNAEFDMAFLLNSISRCSIDVRVNNRVSCALKMARRAWPGRESYRLSDLARDGNLSDQGTHRALGDCQRTLIVYAAAASKLNSVT